MTKQEFQLRIEAGKSVQIDCHAFYKFSGTYFLSTPDDRYGSRTETFNDFNNFWLFAERYGKQGEVVFPSIKQIYFPSRAYVSCPWS